MKALHLILLILVCCATSVSSQDPNYLAHGSFHPDIVAVLPLDDPIPSPGGVRWANSYSYGDSCYCIPMKAYGDNIDDYYVETPKGWMTVKEVCTMLGPGPSNNGSGRPIYNDVQCGNGPPNSAKDANEHRCPGRVDIGKPGCSQIGPRWNFDEVSTLPLAPTQIDSFFCNVGVGDAQDTKGLTGETWTHTSKRKSGIANVKSGDKAEWFKSHRSGKKFTYVLDGFTPNKKYQVELGFAEVYVPNCSEGKRTMRIVIQNKLVKDKLDVYAASGCNAAHYEIFDGSKAIVANGSGIIRISIEATVENAMLSVIKIKPATDQPPPPPPPPPPPAPSPSPSGSKKIVIDVGSPSEGKTLAEGKTWTFGVPSSVLIKNTDQRAKYRTHRSAPKLRFVIPGLEGGSNHTVKLGFAEVWGPNCKNGKRLMDINLNGRTKSRNVDVYKESGGCETALLKEYNDIAADSQGRIIIEITATVENAMLSLIEIDGAADNAASRSVSIDVGKSGGDDTSALSGKKTNRWGKSSSLDVPIQYRTHRWGPDFTYTFDGFDKTKYYRVKLGFAEAYAGNCIAGKRRFKVGINGESVEKNLDVYEAAGCATSGSRNYLLKEYDRKPNSQGKFEISFESIVDNPMVSFIEIVPKS